MSWVDGFFAVPLPFKSVVYLVIGGGASSLGFLLSSPSAFSSATGLLISFMMKSGVFFSYFSALLALTLLRYSD